MQRVLVPLNVAAPVLATADVLLYDSAGWLRDPLGMLIAVAGRSRKCHSATLIKDRGHLVVCGHRWRAQHMQALESEVARHPNRITVFRFGTLSDQEFYAREPWAMQSFNTWRRYALADEARRLALYEGYPLWDLLLASRLFALGTRLFAAPSSEEIENLERAPFCSWATSYLFRKQGADLLHEIADHEMLPGDIEKSPLLLKLFTLAPPTDKPLPIEEYFPCAA